MEVHISITGGRRIREKSSGHFDGRPHRGQSGNDSEAQEACRTTEEAYRERY